MAEYGTVEKIYEAIDECGGDAKALKALGAYWKENLGISRSPMKALTEYRDMAFLSKELAQIRRDYDTGRDLEDFRININKDRAKELFLEYGFKSLIEKL